MLKYQVLILLFTGLVNAGDSGKIEWAQREAEDTVIRFIANDSLNNFIDARWINNHQIAAVKNNLDLFVFDLKSNAVNSIKPGYNKEVPIKDIDTKRYALINDISNEKVLFRYRGQDKEYRFIVYDLPKKQTQYVSIPRMEETQVTNKKSYASQPKLYFSGDSLYDYVYANRIVSIDSLGSIKDVMTFPDSVIIFGKRDAYIIKDVNEEYSLYPGRASKYWSKIYIENIHTRKTNKLFDFVSDIANFSWDIYKNRYLYCAYVEDHQYKSRNNSFVGLVDIKTGEKVREIKLGGKTVSLSPDLSRLVITLFSENDYRVGIIKTKHLSAE